MSSPSSSGSGKRKRNSTMPTSIPIDLLQPSSRDASGEDAAASPTQNATSSKHKKSATSIDSTNPTKRPRTRSNPAGDSALHNGDIIPVIEMPETNTDLASRSKRGTRALSSKEQPGEQNEDEDTKTMAPPGKGGLQDPVGYHTNPPPIGRPVRVYADGVFDLFHLGHMRQLEQAKNAFPDVYLIVGVTGDTETHKRKGLTVLSGAERAETIRHCKWVDEVIPNCPWIVTAKFLEEHKLDYVAHDDLPYGADEGDDIYKPIKEQGKFLVTQRTEGVSTTGIITKIVRDYEQYISRQFKRGTSRQELNVSWLKKNELDLKRHVAELRSTIRNNWTTTGLELSKELRQFWQSNSRPASPARRISKGESELGADIPSGNKPTSPTALSHLSHLEIPRSDSPGGRPSSDFATGYSLGLIGGVRSWMTRSRTSLRDSQHSSSSDSDEGSSEEKSQKGEKTPVRGRHGQHSDEENTDMMET